MNNTENKTDGIVYLYEIQRRHRGHWFDKDSMRFFHSRLPEYGYRVGGKAYFISSEQFSLYEPDGERLYTIRVMDWNTGAIKSVGEFNKLTKSQAKTQLKHILKEQGYNGVF